jgi:hypothetical protein
MTLPKKILFVIGGVLGVLCSVGFGLFLVRYVREGAGSQCFGGPISPGSVVLGLVHVTGFVAAIVICFMIGAGLCARGLVSDREPVQEDEKAPGDQ